MDDDRTNLNPTRSIINFKKEGLPPDSEEVLAKREKERIRKKASRQAKREAEAQQGIQQVPNRKKRPRERSANRSSFERASAPAPPLQFGPASQEPQQQHVSEVATLLPSVELDAEVEHSDQYPSIESENVSVPLQSTNLNGFPANPSSISPHAPDVTWVGGLITKAPWIDGRKINDVVSNNLQKDEAYIRSLASQALPASASPLIEVVDYADFRGDPYALKCFINQKHRRGHYIVVRNFDELRISLNGTDLRRLLALTINTEATVHSALRRARKQQVSKEQTIKTFLENVSSPKHVETILHCPDPGAQVERAIALLDEGLHAFNTMGKQQHDRFVPSDLDRARSWHLLHGPLYHTFPHHDAGGLSTWTVVRSGIKIWVVIVPKGHLGAKSYAEHSELLAPFTTHESGLEYWTSKIGDACDRYAIIADPGTLIVQPPHAFHEVYTPNESVTSGGHFLTFDSLHLVALSRLFDSNTKGITTNATHDYHFFIFVDMVRYIPESTGRKFHRKALAALCAMVLYPDRYCEKWSPDNWHQTSKRYMEQIKSTGRLRRSQRLEVYRPSDKHGTIILPSPTEQAALQVIVVLMEELSLSIDEEGEYLFEGGWMDPGEELEVSNVSFTSVWLK